MHSRAPVKQASRVNHNTAGSCESATDTSINTMSAQLRDDVTKWGVSQLKDLLTAISMATESLSDVIGTHVSDFSRDRLESDVLPYLWSTFKANRNMTTAFLITAEGLVIGYRRNGPEASLLGNQVSVALPSPSSDVFSTVYGFVPDNTTGLPIRDGPMVKVCVIGSCPAQLNTSIYILPGLPPLMNPGWLLGQHLPKGALRLVASMGDMGEPILTVISSLKNSSGHTAAVLSLVFSSSRMQPFLRSLSPVQRYKGRMFVSVGPNLNILSASSGPLFIPSPTPGGRPSFVSALNASDDLIRTTARILNDTMGDQVLNTPIQTQAHLGVAGHGVHYINSVPLEFEGLQLLVVLAVPREELRGSVDASRRRGFVFTVAIMIAMFAVGGLAICVSTTGVSKKLETQEKDLDEAAAANKALTQELKMLTSWSHSAWPDVDMGTPLEKVRTILKGLKPGHVLTHVQLQQLQALITADDLHKPQFLASMEAGPSGGVTSRTGGGQMQMDTETGSWIEILAVGRRRPSTDARRRPPKTRRETTCLDVRSLPMDAVAAAQNARPPSKLSIEGVPEWTLLLPKQPSDDAGFMDVGAIRGSSDIGLLRCSADARASADGRASSSVRVTSDEGARTRASGDRDPSKLTRTASDPVMWEPSLSPVGPESPTSPLGVLPGAPQGGQPTTTDRAVAATSHRAEAHGVVGGGFVATMGKAVCLMPQPLPPLDAQAALQVQSMAFAATHIGGSTRPASTGDGLLDLPKSYGAGSGGSPDASLPGSLRSPNRPLGLLRAISSSKYEAYTGGGDADGGAGGGGGRGGISGHFGGEFAGMGGGRGGYIATGGVAGKGWHIHGLRKLGSWEFDTLALAELAGDQLVPLVGYSLFLQLGLIQEFMLPEDKLMNFLHQVYRGMHDHPYHNPAHITDVSASLFHILTRSGMGDHLRSIDKLAAVCAALVHDYKHPGVNNDFLTRTREDLATIYNDQSPLENFHLAEAFHLLYSNKHCNFLEVLSDGDFTELRHIVIDMVLASDLKRHFVFLDQLKARICQNTPWDASKDSDRMLLLQLSLKVADIGHSAKPLAIHREWSQRVTEEFYRQGDRERAAQLAVSPFMDRFSNNLPKSQVRLQQLPVGSLCSSIDWTWHSCCPFIDITCWIPMF
eukprot:jgi/Mesvir1/23276/Mv20980-RA.3